MNTATNWQESRLDDGSVRFVSEHTARGPIVVTARAVDGQVVWDNPNDVPFLIEDRAKAVLLGA
jgi:hypothetical protein